MEDVWQLFHRLRHRSIKNLYHGRTADKVDKVLHGVPLDPFLPPRLGENPGPHPRGKHLRCPEKSTQCLPPGGGFFRNLAVYFVSYPPPGLCHRLSPWS